MKITLKCPDCGYVTHQADSCKKGEEPKIGSIGICARCTKPHTLGVGYVLLPLDKDIHSVGNLNGAAVISSCLRRGVPIENLIGRF